MEGEGGFHDFEELTFNTGRWLSRQVNWRMRLPAVANLQHGRLRKGAGFPRAGFRANWE
jgi:hypothetical protein